MKNVLHAAILFIAAASAIFIVTHASPGSSHKKHDWDVDFNSDTTTSRSADNFILTHHQ